MLAKLFKICFTVVSELREHVNDGDIFAILTKFNSESKIKKKSNLERFCLPVLGT
jgi:hypothetical protein